MDVELAKLDQGGLLGAYEKLEAVMESKVMVEKLPRVIRLKEVLGMTGLARSTIYDRMNRGSPRYDESFPRPIRLGSNSVGWIELEIVSWINSRVILGGVDRGG